MIKLPPLSSLTSEQKDALILSLVDYIQKLEMKIEELEDEIKSLKKNSKNSHKPPSTDGYKKSRSSLREKSGKKSGGQQGHVGHCLRMREKADQIVIHRLDHCQQCGRDLKNVKGKSIRTAQVFDLPELKIEVTEHHIESKECPVCRCFSKSTLPKNILPVAQYGNHLKALCIYLHHYQYLASGRIVEFFKDLFDHKLSEALIFNAEEESYTNLELFEQGLKKYLKTTKLAYVDETGMRVSNKLNWLHVFSDDYNTHYAVHSKRGQVAMNEIGIIPDFQGILVHDDWRPYLAYNNCEHSLCNAHHLRELNGIIEATNHLWAKNLKNLLISIKAVKDWKKTLSCFLKNLFERLYEVIIEAGYKEYEANLKTGPPLKKSSKKHSKEINLLNRLNKYKFEVLKFMYFTEVPFDNNQAERDIRMMKVKMKVSGCFRQKKGADVFCRIRSYISTLKKRGYKLLQALYDTFSRPVLYPSYS